jgi:putative phosphonate metabolism protein
MDMRYAIYFVPSPESELYRFGSSVLGIDCYTGEAVSFPAGAAGGWTEAVREPRTYGFHATLKAPFRLASGTTENDLIAAVHAFARTRPRADAFALEAVELGAFIALVPTRRCEALDQLAAACVREFDGFRAPMMAAERERRLQTPLTAQQVRQVDAWGYPFVFEDFRFHMTLTGRLADLERKAALHWLSTEFASRPSAHRLVVDRLAISRESNGAFRVIKVVELAVSQTN